MSLNRATAKTFFKSLDKFDDLKELVQRAVDPVSPSLVKSHPKNRTALEDQYFDVVHSWKEFKRDMNKDSDVLNETEENGEPKYENNDNWMKLFKTQYFQLLEKSDEKLDEISNSDNKADTSESNVDKSQEEKQAAQDKKLAECLNSQIVSLTDSITTSVDNISKEVKKMDDGGESGIRIVSLKQDLNSLDSKLDDVLNRLYSQYICLLSGSEIEEKESVRAQYIKQEKLKISNILLELSKKAKEPDKTSSTLTTSPSSSVSKQSSYLKKADPPKWLGDPLEFADFKRKWINQVSSANLPSETELDRLRENVPSQAAKALFGETVMTKAWKVLEGLYGDKDLIANRLKKQSKGIKVKGKHDYDIIIDLVTDVKNIVLRLRTVGAEEMLHVDSEFLSSVFRVLPANSQLRWLEFDKSLFRSKWAAFIQFMEVAREQALQTKVLMGDYGQSEGTGGSGGNCHKCGKSGHKIKNCPEIKANVAQATPSNKDKTNDNNEEKEGLKKRKIQLKNSVAGVPFVRRDTSTSRECLKMSGLLTDYSSATCSKT